MIEKMIGGKIGKQYPSLPTPQEKIILRLENFQKGTAVLGIDFMLRKEKFWNNRLNGSRQNRAGSGDCRC